MTWSMLIVLAAGVAVGGSVARRGRNDPTPSRDSTRRRQDEPRSRSGHQHRWAVWHRQPETPEPDPFLALQLQTRLGLVADHVRQLEGDRRAYARAQRIIAGQLAYDALLAEACRLAGVDVLVETPGDPGERFREEVELASRGWSW